MVTDWMTFSVRINVKPTELPAKTCIELKLKAYNYTDCT